MAKRMGKQYPGFGARLKHLREAAKLSQQALSAKVPCSIFTVSKLEQGRQEPAWSLALNLAAALGVEVTAFLTEAEEREEKKLPGKRGRPRKTTS